MKTVLFIFLLLPVCLIAQGEPFSDRCETGWQFTIHGYGLLPQAEFDNNLDREVIVGMSLGMQYSFPRSPLVVGGEFFINGLGGDIRNSSTTISQRDVPVRQSVRSWMLGGQFYGRYLLPRWRGLQFYADVLVQPTFFTLNDRLEFRQSDEDIYQETLDSDFAVGYGASVGTMIDLPKAVNARLNFRLSYLRTTPTEYYLEDRSGTADPLDSFSSYEGPLDALSLQVGLILPLCQNDGPRTSTRRPKSRSRTRTRRSTHRKPRGGVRD